MFAKNTADAVATKRFEFHVVYKPDKELFIADNHSRAPSPCLFLPMTKPSCLKTVLPSKSTYSQAVEGHQTPIFIASYSVSAKPTDHISLAGIEDLLGSTGGGPVPASIRQGTTKYFSTPLILLTWSVQCSS